LTRSLSGVLNDLIESALTDIFLSYVLTVEFVEIREMAFLPVDCPVSKVERGDLNTKGSTLIVDDFLRSLLPLITIELQLWFLMSLIPICKVTQLLVTSVFYLSRLTYSAY
jgi:hypothetical protein